MYVTARILNKTLDDNYHFDEPFGVVYGNRIYKLRSVPGDLYHLFKKPHQFIQGRISPLIGKSAEWVFSGKDYRGQPQNFVGYLKEVLSSATPISFRGIIPGANTNKDINAFDTFLNAMGMGVSRYSTSTEIYDMIDKWKKKNDIPEVERGTLPPSKYRDIRNAVQDGNEGNVIKHLKELEETTKKPLRQLIEGFKISLKMPFSGSKLMDARFFHSLGKEDQQKYKDAYMDKIRILENFEKMLLNNKEKLAGQPEPEVQPPEEKS
jgi:hypothetical protein